MSNRAVPTPPDMRPPKRRESMSEVARSLRKAAAQISVSSTSNKVLPIPSFHNRTPHVQKRQGCVVALDGCGQDSSFSSGTVEIC